MALTDIPPIILGDPTGPYKANFGSASFALNQTTDSVFWVFQPELPPGVSSITVTRLAYSQAGVTGTCPTYRISLQGVGTSGNPDGTVLGGGTPASATFTSAAGANNTMVSVTLDNSISLSRGVWYAMVIDYSSGTIDASNLLTVRDISGASVSADICPAYSGRNDNGSVTKFAARTPIFAYGTASRWYGRPFLATSTLSYNSGSTPNEYAIAFNLPATLGSKYALAGIIPNIGWVAGHTSLIRLYQGTGAADKTVLQDVTIDTDHVGGIRPPVMFDESSLTELSFGSGYRVGIAPQTTTNQPIYYIDVPTAADWDAWPGGQWFWLSYRTGTGDWTDITTRRLLVDLFINGWNVSSGGGPLIGVLDGGIGQ